MIYFWPDGRNADRFIHAASGAAGIAYSHSIYDWAVLFIEFAKNERKAYLTKLFWQGRAGSVLLLQYRGTKYSMPKRATGVALYQDSNFWPLCYKDKVFATENHFEPMSPRQVNRCVDRFCNQGDLVRDKNASASKLEPHVAATVCTRNEKESHVFVEDTTATNPQNKWMGLYLRSMKAMTFALILKPPRNRTPYFSNQHDLTDKKPKSLKKRQAEQRQNNKIVINFLRITTNLESCLRPGSFHTLPKEVFWTVNWSVADCLGSMMNLGSIMNHNLTPHYVEKLSCIFPLRELYAV